MRKRNRKMAPTCESPKIVATGRWTGSPIAFLPCVFTLLDDKIRILSFAELIRTPRRAPHLHLRFPFDQSPRNFANRKFRRPGDRMVTVKPLKLLVHNRGHELPCGEAVESIGREDYVQMVACIGQLFTNRYFEKNSGLV